MKFIVDLADCLIFASIAVLWARRSKLDLGLSKPSYGKAAPWVLLFALWCTAEWAIAPFLQGDADPQGSPQTDELTLGQALILNVLLGPFSEELLFRGAMFAALLKRWGVGAATLIPSGIWGLTHYQYEWWAIGLIAGSGVILAMIRWKSGSIYIPVVLHAAWNLLVMIDDHQLLDPAV